MEKCKECDEHSEDCACLKCNMCESVNDIQDSGLCLGCEKDNDDYVDTVRCND